MSILLRQTKKELAAQLLAWGFLTDTAIALRVGISRRTLAYWKTDWMFHKRVDQILAAHLRLCRRQLIQELDRELETSDPFFELDAAFRRRRERMIEIDIEKRKAAALLLQNPEANVLPGESKVRARIRRTIK